MHTQQPNLQAIPGSATPHRPFLPAISAHRLDPPLLPTRSAPDLPTGPAHQTCPPDLPTSPAPALPQICPPVPPTDSAHRSRSPAPLTGPAHQPCPPALRQPCPRSTRRSRPPVPPTDSAHRSCSRALPTRFAHQICPSVAHSQRAPRIARGYTNPAAPSPSICRTSPDLASSPIAAPPPPNSRSILIARPAPSGPPSGRRRRSLSVLRRVTTRVHTGQPILKQYPAPLASRAYSATHRVHAVLPRPAHPSAAFRRHRQHPHDRATTRAHARFSLPRRPNGSLGVSGRCARFFASNHASPRPAITCRAVPVRRPGADHGHRTSTTVVHCVWSGQRRRLRTQQPSASEAIQMSADQLFAPARRSGSLPHPPAPGQ